MKVLHLINTIDRGGAENHLYCLARGQKKLGNEIHVIYLKGNNYWYQSLLDEKIIVNKIQNASKINFYNQIKFIKNYIKEFKINIVHSHLPYMEILGYFATRNLENVKYIISKHVDNNFIGGSIKKNKSIFSDLIDYMIYKKVYKIIAISYAVKNYFSKNYFQNFENKIHVIYYGIDEKYIETCLDKNISPNFKNFKSNQEELIFGYIGRLVKQKQVELIIYSFNILKKKTKKN